MFWSKAYSYCSISIAPKARVEAKCRIYLSINDAFRKNSASLMSHWDSPCGNECWVIAQDSELNYNQHPHGILLFSKDGSRYQGVFAHFYSLLLVWKGLIIREYNTFRIFGRFFLHPWYSEEWFQYWPKIAHHTWAATPEFHDQSLHGTTKSLLMQILSKWCYWNPL